MSNNEIMKIEIGTMLAEATGATFCSVKADGDRATAAKVFNAMNNPEFRVADFINKEIPVQDVLIEMVEFPDDETGEVDRVPRVVLMTPDGKAYQATSLGMFNVVKNAFHIFGEAPWEPALTFVIKQRPVKNGSMLTADIKA